jgi:hypothetical protein
MTSARAVGFGPTNSCVLLPGGENDHISETRCLRIVLNLGTLRRLLASEEQLHIKSGNRAVP